MSKSTLNLKLPPLPKSLKLDDCEKNDEGEYIDPISLEPLNSRKVFKIDYGNITRCYNVNSLYKWVIQLGKNDPFTRKPFEDDVIQKLIERYNEVNMIFPKIETKIEIYNTVGNGMTVIHNTKFKNKWVFIMNDGSLKYFNFNDGRDYDYINRVYKENNIEISPEEKQDVIAKLYEYAKNNPTEDVSIIINEILPEQQSGGRRIKLEKLTIKELQQRCIKRKIKYTGLRKAELIAALRR
jgi:hypothetical protein